MRDKFHAYYRPSDAEFQAMWKEGIFAFDASMLLHIYRYSEKTRTTFLEILRQLDIRCGFHTRPVMNSIRTA